MSEKVFEVLEEKINKTVENLREELATVRAGRSSTALVDKVMVNYYGTATPLKQLANISTPDPKTIAITPFDPSVIKEVEHGINEANIGINPSNDGKVVRLVIPPMTEERRTEISKTVKAMGEASKVAIRNLRRTANDELKKEEKFGDLSEDLLKDALEKAQKDTDMGIKKIDELVAEKEKEIMEV